MIDILKRTAINALPQAILRKAFRGKGMISAIPNLKWLHSMVVGRGFKAGRPLIMEIPEKSKFASSKNAENKETVS